jgi:hypothetical protein
MKLDVALWNLTLAAVAGCQQLHVADDDDDDPDTTSSDDTETWGESDDLIDPTTGDTYPDPIPCVPTCEEGYFCSQGECVEEDECYYNPHCDEYDYCSVAEDCRTGFCTRSDWDDYFVCYGADAIPECEAEVALTRTIPLPIEAGGALALAFGDAHAGGGDELLIVRPGEARLVTSGGASVTESVAIAGSGDMWTTASGSGFAISVEESGGTFRITLEDATLVVGDASAETLTYIGGGDFDGDGVGDVVGLVDASLWWSQGTSAGFMPATDFSVEAAGPPAVDRSSAGTVDGVAFHSTTRYTALVPGTESDHTYPAERRTLTFGDVDGDGAANLVGLTRNDTGVLVLASDLDAPRLVLQGLVPPIENDDGGVFRLAAGDLDGDGTDDVIVGGLEVIRVISLGTRCFIDVPIAHNADTLAVGDLDGDGRDDVAFSDGTTTTVLAND